MSRRDLAPSVALALLGAGVAGLGAVACARWRYRATARRRRRLLRVFLARCEEARKMRAGEPYDIREPTVMAVMRVAHTICDEHNAQPLGARPRDEILRDLLGSVDGEMQVEAPFFCDVGAHIHVGRHFHANTGCCMLDVAEIRIGNNVFLAPNVQLYTATHPIDPLERREVEMGRPITIGDDVWIGGGAIVLPGPERGRRSALARW